MQTITEEIPLTPEGTLALTFDGRGWKLVE